MFIPSCLWEKYEHFKCMYPCICGLCSLPIQLMVSQAYQLHVFLKYFRHFIPECYMTLYVMICGLSPSFSLSLIWTIHGVETKSTVCSCSRLIYSVCQGILSSHLEVTRQFIVPKLVGRARKHQAACGALTMLPMSQEPCYCLPSTVPR